ncbi:hypothetical protein TNCV_1009631 [Trichonephila clavipes]|nr:hypothetical protein TNCV_1009631 [Trichonephila clavipes]
MATGSYLTPNYSRSQSEIQGDLHTSPTLVHNAKHLREFFRLLEEAGMEGWNCNERDKGAVLNQEQRQVVYASHTLSSAERNYRVTKRVFSSSLGSK